MHLLTTYLVLQNSSASFSYAFSTNHLFFLSNFKKRTQLFLLIETTIHPKKSLTAQPY